MPFFSQFEMDKHNISTSVHGFKFLMLTFNSCCDRKMNLFKAEVGNVTCIIMWKGLGGVIQWRGPRDAE